MSSSNSVVLRLYDLSRGMAKQLSPMLLGQQIDGIWHTGVYVFGLEYFFGSGGFAGSTASGISSAAGNTFSTSQGLPPVREIPLGQTSKTQIEFERFLDQIAKRFRCCDYSLFHHNCNNFSDEVSKFLVGKSIPDFITGLPGRVLATPMGASIKGMMDNMNNNFQSQLGSAGSHGSFRQYGNATNDSQRSESSPLDTASILDAALAEIGSPPSKRDDTATSSTAPSANKVEKESGGTSINLVKRNLACQLQSFDDTTLVSGMVRRLTNLSDHFKTTVKDYVDIFKTAFLVLQQQSNKSKAALDNSSIKSLQPLVPVIDTILRSGLQRAAFPAFYLFRLLCLHAPMIPIIMKYRDILDWCISSLISKKTKQPNAIKATGQIRALVLTSLVNMTSHKSTCQQTLQDDKSSIETLLFEENSFLINSILSIGEHYFVAPPDAPAAPQKEKPNADEPMDDERIACAILLGNIAAQLSIIANDSNQTTSTKEKCSKAALNFLRIACIPLHTEEQIQSPPKLLSPNVRQNLVKACTELLHTSVTSGGRKATQALIKEFSLMKVARGNARRMAAAVNSNSNNGEQRARSQQVSGAFFIQVMAAMKDDNI